jgi:hypothetical protein
MIPTWTYVKGNTGLYVNMFVGSRINVGQVAGTDVEVIQKTDYPWKGKISITVNPQQSTKFSVYVRIPDRTTSRLYKDSPVIRGVKSFSVNGTAMTPEIQKGYAVVTREWKAGDHIELELPLEPQCVKADSRIAADAGTTALKYGPLVYNVETLDNQNIDRKIGDAQLQAKWRPELFGGIVVITGKWADGSDLAAIPNYARMNRVGPPHEYPGDEEIDSVTGSTVAGGTAAGKRRRTSTIESKVWI